MQSDITIRSQAEPGSIDRSYVPVDSEHTYLKSCADLPDPCQFFKEQMDAMRPDSPICRPAEYPQWDSSSMPISRLDLEYMPTSPTLQPQATYPVAEDKKCGPQSEPSKVNKTGKKTRRRVRSATNFGLELRNVPKMLMVLLKKVVEEKSGGLVDFGRINKSDKDLLHEIIFGMYKCMRPVECIKRIFCEMRLKDFMIQFLCYVIRLLEGRKLPHVPLINLHGYVDCLENMIKQLAQIHLPQ